MEGQNNTKPKRMDRKIRIALAAALMLVCTLSGCKKDEWLDWKVMNQMVLEANKNTPGVITTGSGLQYHIISDSQPTEPKPDDESYILCNYIVMLPAGNKQVDSGTAATFALSNVVAGFREGIKKIHKYGKIEMWVPADIAYGEDGVGSEGSYNYIPPYSTVYFQVDLRDVAKY